MVFSGNYGYGYKNIWIDFHEDDLKICLKWKSKYYVDTVIANGEKKKTEMGWFRPQEEDTICLHNGFLTSKRTD